MKLSFRAYMGEADCLAMLRIREESAVADKADRTSTCEKFPSLENLKKSVDRADIADRLILMTYGDVIIGYSQITWWDLADGIRLYLHNEWVTPAYRSQDVMSQFLAKIEERILALATRQGTANAAAIGSNASESERYRTEALISGGYAEVWAQVDMELASLNQLPAPSWPDGITVSPLKPADYRKIWAVYNDSYKGGFGIPAPTDDTYQDFIDDIEHPEMCFVAWDNQTVAGFILCTSEYGLGFVDELVTNKAYQRRGIARALLLHSLSNLPANGLDAMRLLTATNNHSGARSLYEKIGFHTVKLYKRYRKPVRG